MEWLIILDLPANKRGAKAPLFVIKGGSMSLKDLKGKTIYELDRADFEKLFCEQCHENQDCPKDDKKILGCKAFVDSGLWDRFYRK
ncbi:hypothetical protein ES708_25303 [subsurface metagenome]